MGQLLKSGFVSDIGLGYGLQRGHVSRNNLVVHVDVIKGRFVLENFLGGTCIKIKVVNTLFRVRNFIYI